MIKTQLKKEHLKYGLKHVYSRLHWDKIPHFIFPHTVLKEIEIEIKNSMKNILGEVVSLVFLNMLSIVVRHVFDEKRFCEFNNVLIISYFT